MLKPYENVADVRYDHHLRFDEHMKEECTECDMIDNLCLQGREIFESMNVMIHELEGVQGERS